MKRLPSLCLAGLLWIPTNISGQEAPGAPRNSEQRLTDAETEIQALWRSYFVVVRDDLPNTKGSLDCSGARYEEIKATNSFLVFFVACERIEPYQDGYRATIAIGTPHTFGFSRVSGTLSYGENIAAALVKESQRATFATTSEMRPGTWTRIAVPLPGTGATDVGKIVVEVHVSGISGFGGGAASPRSTDAPQHGLLGRAQDPVSPNARR
jgi:hypothetical protein